MPCKHTPINIVEPPTYQRTTICATCGINLKKLKRQRRQTWLKNRAQYERSQK